MLIGPIFANVMLTSNLSRAPRVQLENVVASVELGFLPQWGRHQNASPAARPADIHPASRGALR
jgi:hypothetical protein